MSGEASVRAMKPRTARVVSGPAGWAKSPPGKADLMAVNSAAVAVVVSRVRRLRLDDRVPAGAVTDSVAGSPARSRGLIISTKSPAARWARVTGAKTPSA